MEVFPVGSMKAFQLKPLYLPSLGTVPIPLLDWMKRPSAVIDIFSNSLLYFIEIRHRLRTNGFERCAGPLCIGDRSRCKIERKVRANHFWLLTPPNVVTQDSQESSQSRDRVSHPVTCRTLIPSRSIYSSRNTKGKTDKNTLRSCLHLTSAKSWRIPSDRRKPIRSFRAKGLWLRAAEAGWLQACYGWGCRSLGRLVLVFMTR